VKWPVVDPEKATAWTGRSLRDNFSGIVPEGFEARVRVLHAIYEMENIPSSRTHDEVEKERIARGLVPPLVVNGVNVGALTTDSGIPLGIASRREGSKRLHWRELAARYNVAIDPTEDHALRPISMAIGSSWPYAMQGPPEGSLDEESLSALVNRLRRWTGLQDCFLYYNTISVRRLTREDGLEPRVYRVPLDEIVSVSTSEEVIGSPQSWWPEDRAWHVYTDCDLHSTVIGGSEAIVGDIAADADLETLRF
jgi:hypothetical protein